MKHFLSLRRSVALAAIAFATTALGDNALDSLEKSQQAMLKAPAMRLTMESIDHTKKKTMDMIVEFVHPDGMHSKVSIDGKLSAEIISTDHQTFTRHGEEPFHAVPGNIPEMIMNARSSASLQDVAEKATDAKFIGHQDVNGMAASVYTFQTHVGGLTVRSKVWISDKNSLPLKEERHTQGETKLGNAPGVKVDRDAHLTFDYDPSIKITLPAS